MHTKAIVALGLLLRPLLAGASSVITVHADPAVLRWELFRRVEAVSETSEDARIAAEMSFPQPLRMENEEGTYRLPPFTIRVAPNASQTVVRRSVRPSRELLRHEQGHYDLVVLAARALARDLETLRASSARELARQTEDLVAEHTRRAERLSDFYDRETDHSHDAHRQAAWNGTLADALALPAVAKIAGLPL